MHINVNVVQHNSGTHECTRSHLKQVVYAKSHPRSRIWAASWKHAENIGNLRWTLDYPEDLELVRRVFEALGPEGQYFGMQEILRFLDANPDVAGLNSHLSDFVPDQPAHWDSEGYLSDLRDDIANLISEAGLLDSARNYGAAASTYAQAREMIGELITRAESFARLHGGTDTTTE